MILDHIENYELRDDLRSKFNNELNVLHNYHIGLDYLYHQVRNVEKKALSSKSDKTYSFGFGNIPGIPKAILSLVSCIFQWYAISACNYVWLVGWLLRQADENFYKSQKYAGIVIPKVQNYRHKIAAHLPAIYPKDENKADLLAVLLPLNLTSNGFFVGGWDVSIKHQK